MRKVLECKRTFRRVQRKIRRLQVDKVFYYVPVLRTLQEQLKSKILLKMIYSGKKPINSENSNYYLHDFNDGFFVRNHALFSTVDNALKLLIYYDDCNIANPMTNKIHPVGLFYYQLANIDPVYRGKLICYL